MAHARIGKIRLKAGGAEVRLIRQELPNAGGEENWQGKIIENARTIAAHNKPGSELVGYVMIGLFSDGATSTCWRYDFEHAPVPRALLPSYAAEIIRRDLITEVEACDVVNRANGFTD